jgi:hypothetical protein
MALVESFIVHAIDSTSDDYKHFGRRKDAIAYASTVVRQHRANRADIYSVPVANDAAIAMAALKGGYGELVQSKSESVA